MTAVLETYGRGNRGRGLMTAVGTEDPDNICDPKYRADVLESGEPWTAEYQKAMDIEQSAAIANRRCGVEDRPLRASPDWIQQLERYVNTSGKQAG